MAGAGSLVFQWGSTIKSLAQVGTYPDITLDVARNQNFNHQPTTFSPLQAPLDTDVGASSALSATLFSQSLSNKKGPLAACGDTTQCCGQGEGGCDSAANRWVDFTF